MFNLDYINPQTASVFKLLLGRPELEGFTLIGGTALALQAGHRDSLDLDFVLLGEDELPHAKISSLLRNLILNSHEAKHTPNTAQASRFRINTGLLLESRIMDCVIDGVKVQFFTKPDWPDGFRDNLIQYRSPIKHGYFDILNMEGIATTKTLVLADRVKSRDLYDLLWFLEEGLLSITVMEELVSQYDPTAMFDSYTDKMTGTIPVDENDEGLDAIGVDCTAEDLHVGLSEFIDEYERHLASEMLSP